MNEITEMQMTQAQRSLALVNKWAWMTEGITDNSQRALVSQLLENQNRKGVSLLEADANTGNLPTAVFPSKISFPAIVQTFPALASNELVQVQALDQPRALVLYKRYIKSTGPAPLTHTGNYGLTAEGGTPGKVRMQLDSLLLTAEKWMLGMQWSTELEEDGMAFGNIDVAAELVQIARDELGAELDSLVIGDLFTAAAGVGVTGPNGMQTSRPGAGSVNFAENVYASYETPKSHQERLLDSLIDLKVKIFNASFRQADFIVGDAASVARLEKMQSFAKANERGNGPQIIVPGGAMHSGSGFGTGPASAVPFVGRLNNTFDVYISAVAPANTLLMGVKRAGYVLGIYKPFELTQPWYDNTNDSWIRSVRSRVARQTVDAAYFGTLLFV